MFTLVRSGVLALAILLMAPALSAQEGPKRCGCRSGSPPPVIIPTDPNAGGVEAGSEEGGNDNGWVALLPLGPLAAMVSHRTGAVLAPVVGDSGLTPREIRASETFRANADSLTRGMRAPDTATPLPNVAAIALTFGLAGAALLRRQSA